MPKGSPPNIIHTKTWSGKVIRPRRTKAQLAARDKSMARELSPSDTQYKSARSAAAARKDIRGDESASSPAMRKMRENPYAALKRKAASRAKKK